MRKILIVVDMQNDFVTGSLGSEEARKIVPNVKKKIDEYVKEEREIFFTRDTHRTNYLETFEGKRLPVEHCICRSDGWFIIPELDIDYKHKHIFNKETFGYKDWGIINWARMEEYKEDWQMFDDFEFEVVGVCTDICVVSNVLALRMFFPSRKITVDASCCAGTSVEAHKAALTVMKSCQIDVIGEDEENDQN